MENVTKTLSFILQDAIRGLDCLKSSTWFVIVLETFAYMLLIGRLLHDSMTQSVMTQQMIGFLASAADIMEFFTLFEEEKVLQDNTATLFVLLFWTFSFLQFIPIWGSHNLGKTETEHKNQLCQKTDDETENENDIHTEIMLLRYALYRLAKKRYRNIDLKAEKEKLEKRRQTISDGKHFGWFFCKWFDDSELAPNMLSDSTDRYEAGFSYVFQDGPFLVLRVFLILRLNLFTQSLLFFTLKNFTLSILLLTKFKCDFMNFLSFSLLLTLIMIIVGIID